MPPRIFLSDLQVPAYLLARPGQSANPLPGAHAPAVRRIPLLAGTVLVLGALALAGMAPTAQAAGLGRLTVHSQLGQPLDAEVEVPAVGRDEAPSLQVRLASQAAFKQANLEFNPALTQLRFDLETKADGSYAVHVTSAQAISEPYLDLLLELTWSSGRVLREYTVLLDPPGLKQSPEIVAPVAAPPPVATPAPVAPPVAVAPPAPAPAPAPVAAAEPVPPPVAQRTVPQPQPQPQPQPRAAPAAPSTVHVKPGDTLGKIALETKSGGVSLDQMLVALVQANPNAFVAGNMNRLLAGKDVVVPSSDTVSGIDDAQAHREVAAQSADFAAYRSRLSQVAAAAPVVPEKQTTAAAQGKVSTKVEDKGAAPKSGDQLKIAKADAKAAEAAAAAAKKDEEVARQRALKEEKERAAALKKTNDDLKKAMDLEAKNAAAKKKLDDEKAARDKVLADKAAKEQAIADKRAADKAAADKAAADKLALKSAAAAAAAAKQEPAAPAAPKVEAPKAAPAPAPAEPSGGFTDLLESPVVLGTAGGVLLLALVALNIFRRQRGGKSGDFKVDDPMAANSLFGAAGGQSVDTGATSTFNSSFIPAASQLDSNEVDPVAEADVYVAYGREEQAEDILKEALRLQPDRHAVRVKLLEIYSRRGDTASFNAVAKELHDRTGAVGDDWDRAAKLGKSLDPSNPMYAGAASAADAPSHAGPATDMRMEAGSRPTTGGLAANTNVSAGATTQGDFDIDTLSAMVGDQKKLLGLEPDAPLPDTALAPETLMPIESHAASTNTMQRFEAKLPPETVSFTQSPLVPPAPPPKPAPAPVSAAPTPAPARSPATSIDFGSLDFDLGPSKLNIEAPTELPVESAETESPMPATVSVVEPPTIPSLDLMFPPTTPGGMRPTPPPTVTGTVPIPNIDLNLPASAPTRAPATATAGSLEEALSRPTLVGGIGGLADGDMPRLSSNTDQATVPLIDFDLTGADAALTGRRTETQAGSPMASQMATKLDLARGYIDLGVKDGARELLEEVMKDGTREQRQQAVELIKLVEA